MMPSPYAVIIGFQIALWSYFALLWVSIGSPPPPFIAGIWVFLSVGLGFAMISSIPRRSR